MILCLLSCFLLKLHFENHTSTYNTYSTTSSLSPGKAVASLNRALSSNHLRGVANMDPFSPLIAINDIVLRDIQQTYIFSTHSL